MAIANWHHTNRIYEEVTFFRRQFFSLNDQVGFLFHNDIAGVNLIDTCQQKKSPAPNKISLREQMRSEQLACKRPRSGARKLIKLPTRCVNAATQVAWGQLRSKRKFDLLNITKWGTLDLNS